MNEPWDVIVIGAGAAGLLAATRAAERRRRTLLLEKNARPGVKILMSGGTRCNVTQHTNAQGIVRALGSPGRFLQSALARFGPDDVVALLDQEGVPTKVEPQGKVFPRSDRAADVLAAFTSRLARSGAQAAFDEPACEIESLARSDAPEADLSHVATSTARFRVVTARRSLECESLIVATGGRSYPGSGTTGDAYAWLERFGHTIVPPRPALTPLTTNEPWVRALMGVTLADASIEITDPETADRKPLATSRGGLLFTHFGLSGPAALNVSRVVSGHAHPHRLVARLDQMPGTSNDELSLILSDTAAREGSKSVATAVAAWVPRRLAEELLRLAEVTLDQRVAELAKPRRRRLIDLVKRLEIRLSGTMGFRKAEVTAGGVSLAEIDSRSMQSRLLPGLFVAGEALDLDGPIGGYNFQIAFSTGILAGDHA